MLFASSCSSFCSLLIFVTVGRWTIRRQVNAFPHCTVTFYKIGVCHLLQVFQCYLLQSFEICKQISPVPCLAVSSGQIHGKTQVGVEAPDQACSCIRSEEHTSELQSRGHLVCRLLLEKKNTHR